jgi:predicted enzyme related to lactoylglutathione lyase
MIKIKNIDHVYLFVNSIEESKKYYEKFFDIKAAKSSEK